MTRTNKRQWTWRFWCQSCRSMIQVSVEMLTPIPELSGRDRWQWQSAAIREAEAKFEREHAATCGRQAT